MIRWGFFSILVFLTVGCAMGHCRKPQETEIQNENSAVGSLGKGEDMPANSNPSKRVFVFKYDGSLQCDMGKPVSLKDMRAELKGIPVYSMEKRHDGQMHIQVCGSITGEANVYEIAEKDLKEAEKRGFKLWNFK